MKISELPFGKFIHFDKAFVEVIIYEGIELTADMIDQFHDHILENSSGPIGVLINKTNEYTYTFDAQMRLSHLQGIDAVAVVAYSEISRQATESIIKMPRRVPWNIAVFDNRKKAIKWLNAELGKSNSTVLSTNI